MADDINYLEIKQFCEANTNVSKLLIDDFLIPFIGEREGWHEKIARQLLPFKSVLRKMPEDWAGWLYCQIAGHKLFKKNGIATRYKENIEILKRTRLEKEFIDLQIKNPWQFSYCRIKTNPFKDFYLMQDVLSDKSILLYSPAISSIMDKIGMEPLLWFMLIGFNGECYQTYGPIEYFKGFQPFDIIFFAKKLKPDLLFSSDVCELVDSNPVPFLMLYVAGEIPLTYNRDDMMVCCQSEYHVKDINLAEYENDFTIEEKQKVCRMALNDYNGFPHFTNCYYDRKKNRLMLSAMTQRGYDALVLALNKHGNAFPKEPDILSTMAMISAIKEVLNIEVVINPYEKRFAGKKPSPEAAKHIEKMNLFLKNMVDKINGKQEYDIESLATEAGLDFEVAKQITESVLKKFEEMPKR